MLEAAYFYQISKFHPFIKWFVVTKPLTLSSEDRDVIYGRPLMWKNDKTHIFEWEVQDFLELLPVGRLSGDLVAHQGGDHGLAVRPPQLHVPFQLSRTIT